MSTLYPAPVSTRQFHFDKDARLFIGEISSTHGFGRVWNDSCDEGLTLVSARTGKHVTFAIVETIRDADGDITQWMLRPTPDSDCDADLGVVLFND